MKVQGRATDGKFYELEAVRVVVSEGDLTLEVSEVASIRDLSPEIAAYLRVRGLEIRVRPDGSVNLSNISESEVSSPITVATDGEVLCDECSRKRDPSWKLAMLAMWLDAEIEAARQLQRSDPIATRSALERVKARLVG